MIDPRPVRSAGSRAAVNKVILRVNDRIVTLYDYEKKVAERLAALRHAEVPPARKRQMLDTAPEDTLREIFDETLLLSRADQLGIFASPVEIDGMVARVLAQQAGITSDEQFRAALAESGMTEEQMRANMGNTILVRCGDLERGPTARGPRPGAIPPLLSPAPGRVQCRHRAPAARGSRARFSRSER